jgi:hypothetical protein
VSITYSWRRLKVLREIDRAEIRWYHFQTPEARNIVTDSIRTKAVEDLAAAELVDIGDAEFGSFSVPQLTDAGRDKIREWEEA